MKYLKPALALVFLFPLVTGCAYLEDGAGPGAPIPPAKLNPNLALDKQRYLDYFHQVELASPEVRKREFLNREADFLRNGRIFDRLRLAFLLSLPNTGFENSMRASDLLVEAARKSGNQADLNAFSVALLQLNRDTLVALERARQPNDRMAERGPLPATIDRSPDRRRLEDRVDALEQKLKSEQKRADQAQSRADALEKRLAALKRLEQRLNRIP